MRRQEGMEEQDRRYLQMILNRLNTCREYRPKFGTGRVVTLEDFKRMYREDPFYHWFGLDNPALYAAHKAAGGITSVYRQIGLGCEEVFRQVIRDKLGLSAEEVTWSYEVNTQSGRTRTLSLDGRVEYRCVSNPAKAQRIEDWVQEFASRLEVAPKVARALDGIVFEIRQGYKSKDAKRQNADISNIVSAYAHGYFPAFILLSTQIDNDVEVRYRHSKCPVLIGSLAESPFHSTYAFCEHIIGYDLAAFFKHNSGALRQAIEEILEVLLTPG